MKITTKEFLASDVLELDVGGNILTGEPRSFASGNLGWYLGGAAPRPRKARPRVHAIRAAHAVHHSAALPATATSCATSRPARHGSTPAAPPAAPRRIARLTYPLARSTRALPTRAQARSR